MISHVAVTELGNNPGRLHVRLFEEYFTSLDVETGHTSSAFLIFIK
jgi:hypothetical protein